MDTLEVQVQMARIATAFEAEQKVAFVRHSEHIARLTRIEQKQDETNGRVSRLEYDSRHSDDRMRQLELVKPDTDLNATMLTIGGLTKIGILIISVVSVTFTVLALLGWHR